MVKAIAARWSRDVPEDWIIIVSLHGEIQALKRVPNGQSTILMSIPRDQEQSVASMENTYLVHIMSVCYFGLDQVVELKV